MTTGYFVVRTILNNNLSRMQGTVYNDCRYGCVDQIDGTLFSERFVIYLILHLG